MHYQLNYLLKCLGNKMSQFFKDEDGDVNIVSIIVIIGIVIIVAVVFKKQLSELVGKLFNAIGVTGGNVINNGDV